MGNGVEGEVMVDELPEIGVGRRYSLVLFGVIYALWFGLFRRRDHGTGQRLEILVVELCRR
jgi:hypothetical protein